MGLGGPVWHASVGGKFAPQVRRRLALEALKGVGDAKLGEWMHDRPVAFHIRRRVSELELPRVGPVRDLRGTEEALDRLRVALLTLPPALEGWAREEIA